MNDCIIFMRGSHDSGLFGLYFHSMSGRIQLVACKYAVGQVLQDSAIGNNLLPLLSPVNVCRVKKGTGRIHSQSMEESLQGISCLHQLHCYPELQNITN